MKKYRFSLNKMYKIANIRNIINLMRTKSKIKLSKGILKNFDNIFKNSNYELIDYFVKFSESKEFHNHYENNTNRFFSWINIFIQKNYNRNDSLKILEIGSASGHSALFFLWFFKIANIDCVDVWDRFSKFGILNTEIEEMFDKNLSEYSDRVNKIKLFSLEFFAKKLNQRCLYDIVYIDGSHEAEDVLSDCLYSFALLKINGLMIIDDVFHMCHKRYQDNSIKAIDCFLNLKGNDLKIIRLNSQLFITKLKDSKINSVKIVNY